MEPVSHGYNHEFVHSRATDVNLPQVSSLSVCAKELCLATPSPIDTRKSPSAGKKYDRKVSQPEAELLAGRLSLQHARVVQVREAMGNAPSESQVFARGHVTTGVQKLRQSTGIPKPSARFRNGESFCGRKRRPPTNCPLVSGCRSFWRPRGSIHGGTAKITFERAESRWIPKS